MAGPLDSGTPHSTTLRRVLPAIAWACLIFAGSSIPGKSVPGGFSVEGHFLEYAIFGALILHALTARRWERPLVVVAFLALGLAAAYAATDEFHQSFVPGRVPDPLDWAVDVVGTAAGIAVWILTARWRSRRQGA